MTVSPAQFPNDFVWGTATASYQVGGAAFEDGRTASIWDTFVRVPGTIADCSVGDDHYHRWPEDVRLMERLGVNAYRFSISWSRVLTPDGKINPTGIDFYRHLAAALRQRNMTPYATLYHWDLPQHLEDQAGWIWRGIVDAFAHYVSTVVGEPRDLITDWITLNKPWCSTFLGYASGHHAPGKQLGPQASHAAHHQLLGHGRATAAIRHLQPHARVGLSLNLYSVQPASDTDADRDAARRIDGLQNRLFLEPVLRGNYPADVLADLGEQDWFAAQPASDLTAIATPIDFVGINYYSPHTVAAGSSNGTAASANPGSEFVQVVDTGAPRTQMGWEIHPDGLIDVLEQADSYARPRAGALHHRERSRLSRHDRRRRPHRRPGPPRLHPAAHRRLRRSHRTRPPAERLLRVDAPGQLRMDLGIQPPIRTRPCRLHDASTNAETKWPLVRRIPRQVPSRWS